MAIKMTQQEKQIEEMKIGIYGRRWIEWMENNHKKDVRDMKKRGVFLEVAKSTDEYARDYKKLLDRQYDEYHFRPLEFASEDERKSWEFTRNYYTDGVVMRERVLKVYRNP